MAIIGILPGMPGAKPGIARVKALLAETGTTFGYGVVNEVTTSAIDAKRILVLRG